MQKIDTLQSQIRSEQTVKEAVYEKLAKLEAQVKTKSALPTVTLESYQKEQEKLAHLERMRAKIASAI